MVSSYLRSFVVARINPLRWIKGDPPPLQEVMKTMRERAAKFNVEKIRPQDLAGAGGPPDDAAGDRQDGHVGGHRGEVAPEVLGCRHCFPGVSWAEM